MKKAALTLFIIVLLSSQPIFSLDLEFIGGLGNLAFNNDRTMALSDDVNPGAFSSNFYPLIRTGMSGEYRNFSFKAGFERDPILRNRFFTNLRADFNYFYVETGPFIGLFNSQKQPFNPGLSAAMGLQIPGIIFAELNGSSTLAAPLDLTGFYYQNNGGISLGFWVPYVVCSLNMIVKNYAYHKETDLIIKDSLNRYFFRADVYTKNIPYTIQVDLGFQNLSRSYYLQDLTDEFKSIFMGLEVTYTLNQSVKFIFGGEMPVYSWSKSPMKNPPKSSFLFEAWTGAVWTLQGKDR